MTPQYLVDTDWVIHYFNGHPVISGRLRGLFNLGLGLSIISLAELYEGALHSRNPREEERALEALLKLVSVIGVDDETCRIFGQERGRLRKAGRLIADFDLMIGATAVRHGLVLLTNNRRHFERISGLQVESA